MENDKNIPNLIGQKFGRLTVIGEIEKGGKCLCQCECGNQKAIRARNLTHGLTKSCGCLHREMVSSLNRKDGRTHSATWSHWRAMKSRCMNPATKSYPDYGGRGIRVCEQWINSFETFLADMGECPEGMTIDREDHNGDYTPANCRWATRKQQNRNSRRNRFLTLNGETLCAGEWAERTGIGYRTIINRMNSGWSDEDVLTKPVDRSCWHKSR